MTPEAKQNLSAIPHIEKNGCLAGIDLRLDCSRDRPGGRIFPKSLVQGNTLTLYDQVNEPEVSA